MIRSYRPYRLEHYVNEQGCGLTVHATNDANGKHETVELHFSSGFVVPLLRVAAAVSAWHTAYALKLNKILRGEG